MLDGLRAARPKHHTPKPDYFGTARSICVNKIYTLLRKFFYLLICVLEASLLFEQSVAEEFEVYPQIP
jgi:hypothetical protein